MPKKGSIRDKVRALREKNAAAGSSEAFEGNKDAATAATAATAAQVLTAEAAASATQTPPFVVQGEAEVQLQEQELQQEQELRQQEGQGQEEDQKHQQPTGEEDGTELLAGLVPERQDSARGVTGVCGREEDANSPDDARPHEEQKEGELEGNKHKRDEEARLAQHFDDVHGSGAGIEDGVFAQVVEQESDQQEEPVQHYEVLEGAGGTGEENDQQLTEAERLKLWREAARVRAGASPQQSQAEQPPENVVLRGYDDEEVRHGRTGGGAAGSASGGLEVWVADHKVVGSGILYEVAVRMRGFDWFVERTWKQIVMLRTALAAASDAETQERQESGAGRTNVILPKLPQDRSVGTALSLVARKQTAQTRALAEELSTFFKLLLLAIKGTQLLSLVTDWLEAPAHLELRDQGEAGGCAQE